MPSNQSERPQFYEEQYLGAADLTAAVEYGRLQQARHALGAHTWGVAIGLQLVERVQAGSGVSIHLLPGYAWDGYGRPIVVLAPYKIPEVMFSAIKFDPAIDTAAGGKGRLIPVWLRYDETTMQHPRPGFEVCDAADQYSRIQEAFRIEIGDRPSTTDRYSGITVGAKSLTDATTALGAFDPTAPLVSDEAIPQQTFPELQDKARWLIPIGYVRWLPVQNASGHFVARDDSGAGGLPRDSDQTRAFRRYIGVVTESIEAADGRIRLKNRGKPFSSVSSNDLVWIEGDVRVEGDLRLFDYKLDFKDSWGRDNDIPLSISRVEEPGKGSLHAVIGKSGAGANTFAVGPIDGANKFTAKLTVRDDGKVGIGIDVPGFTLDVAGRMRVRQGNSPSESAGMWLFQNIPNADRAFVGMAFDDRVGFYGNSGAQWGLVMNTTNGNVGIGAIEPTHKLHVVADDAVGLFESRGTQAYLRFTTTEGLDNRVEIANRPGGRLSLWTVGAGDAFNITRDGKVGIGTSTPKLNLEINGDDFGRDGGPATLHLWGSRIGDTGSAQLFVRAVKDGTVVFDGENNRVGIGITNPIDKLHVIGDMRISGTARKPGGGSWTSSSDKRLKKGVAPLTNALGRLLQLRGVRFEWKEPAEVGNLTGPQTGLIAQEVAMVFPEWVSTGSDGYKELTIRGFEALTIEALREMQAEIEALKVSLDKSTGHQPTVTTRTQKKKAHKETAS